MPLSKAQRKQIYSTLSSIVEHSFLDDAADSAAVGVVPSPKPTRQIKRWAVENDTSSHLQSFVVVYTMIFFNGCCFTAVVPSIPFFLQLLAAPPSFLGLVVSFYSLGQIVGSTCIAGWINDKLDSKTVLTLTSMTGLFATLFYVIGTNHWFVLFSRWLTGVSAGWEFTTELSFIASNTSTTERTTFLATVTAVNVIGFIIGPALSTLLSMLNFNFMGLEINEYTSPGWLLVIMFFVDLIMVRVFFQDDSSSLLSERSNLLVNNGKSEKRYGTHVEKESDHAESQVITERTAEQHPPSLLVVVSLIFIQFTLMCGWSVLETITSPLARDSFGWQIHECNLLFTCGGAASLTAYVAFVLASKAIADRFLIAYAIFACIVGLLLMIIWSSPLLPPYLWRFVAGYLIVNAGFMTGRPVTFALYSKLIPEKKYQGVYLGYMVAGGSAARSLGPFVAVYCYYHLKYGMNTLVLFGSIAAIMMTCLVVMFLLWPSLIPAACDKEKCSDERLSSHQNDGLSMHVDKANDNILSQ